MKLFSMLKSFLIATLVIASVSVSAAQVWVLRYKAQYPLWEDGYPLTNLDAVLTTRGAVAFPEGPGWNVTDIQGTRNGVPITGLWKASKGDFFGGWTPAQGILNGHKSLNGQRIPFDGLAYVTADGIQHVLYGSTTNIAGKLETIYFEMNQWASQNPNDPWVTFGGTALTLERIK